MARKALLIMALCGVAAPAIAQDDDEAFDEALRNFGFTAGAAWRCSEEGARDQVDQDALEAFNGIVRLFGSDRAFGFAAAFGAGIAAEIAEEDCAAQIAAFEDGLASARETEAEANQ